MDGVAEPIPRLQTLDDYYAMPDDSRYEFENGELIEMPAPHLRHQRVCQRISTLLDSHVTSARLGEVLPGINLQLGGQGNYIPDLVFVSEARRDVLDEDTGRVHGAPSLIVEIHSAGSSSRDRVTKFNAYFRAGVEWYWLVDRDSLAVEEYHATRDGYIRSADAEPGGVFQPKALPGLELNLAELLGETASEA